MVGSCDGFVIAEADLEIRGPGDFLGTRQAGLPELKVADILRDGGVLEQARREAFSLVESDPELAAPGNDRLRAELMLRWGSVDGTADLDLLLGADVPAGLGWLRCHLKDDGEFTVPRALVALLPPHSAERPWLARLSRSREVPIPGFTALPLRLELSDSAWLQ